ncbi:MAG: hypothetical protein RLZ12_919 [Bacillota bacterium]
MVKLAGELDHHTARKTRSVIEDELKLMKNAKLILNLAELNFMDSSGLGVILGRYRALKEAGGELMLCGLSPAIKKLLQLSGLLKIMTTYENEQEALKAYEVTL